jgi:hypothetical protein
MNSRIAMMPVLLVVGLTGCSVTGTWKAKSMEPQQHGFSIAEMTLNNDGTYSAVSSYDGKKESASGTYTYDDGVLSVTTPKGEKRTYDIAIRQLGKVMEVSGEAHGHEITTTLVKAGSCCPFCSGCSRCQK